LIDAFAFQRFARRKTGSPRLAHGKTGSPNILAK
jgi:hypothetical protein